MINDKLHVERNRRELPRNITALSHILGTFVVRSSHETRTIEVVKANIEVVTRWIMEKMNFTFSVLHEYVEDRNEIE